MALHLAALAGMVALTRPAVPPAASEQPAVEVVFQSPEEPVNVEPAAEPPAEPPPPTAMPNPEPPPPELPLEPPMPPPQPEPPPQTVEPLPPKPPSVIRPPVVPRPPRPKPSPPTAITRQEEARLQAPVAPPVRANPSPTAPPAIDASWQASVAGWLASHKTYPDYARRNGEQGRVSIRFTIDRSGHVVEAAIISASGSAQLDAAAMALVRGASFAAFPASMPQERITITTSVRYTLRE